MIVTLVRSRLAAAAVLALAAALPTQAATINWTTGPTFNGANGHQGILTNGTLVEAVNLRGNPGAAIVVDPTGLNISFTTVNSPFFGVNFAGAGGGGNSDAGWATILGTFEWANGSNVSAPSFLSGLNIGTQYQVQFFAARTDCCTTRTHWYGDGNGNLSTAVAGGSYTSIVGSFTADAATQWIQVFDSTRNPILNAYVLRDLTVAVPEPGTYALMLVGLAAVAGVSRRRRG
ncbi:MAG: PEP-CTERM sorting domain-containing protein [Aquabacterium sp.]